MIVYSDHLEIVLRAGIAAMKKEEEERNGEGWCSGNRQVAEELAEGLRKREYVEIRHR